jgi:hypothetical protein
MAETLEKLRPDRDLQCYFERPSAVAALSETSASGFTISGSWRQQFDWAVLEWNRDNVFEHPAFRNLPDGDLSGLTLAYEETRTNCVAMDSDLYPTVEWPYLRVWAEAGGVENFYKVSLKDYATPIEGSYQAASAEFELQGSPTSGDYIGLAWMSEHHTYQLYGTDTLETAVQALVDSVNAFSSTMQATRTGSRIRLTRLGGGANGNRIGVYTQVAGAKTESWQPSWQQLSGGTSPAKWRVELNFGALVDMDENPVPMNAVRKMRWTYAAELEAGAYQRSEFQVTVSNWTVSGTNRAYMVAGPGNRRIEDDSAEITYGGSWAVARGNFSGGSIHHTTTTGAGLSCGYRASGAHRLHLGTRKTFSGGQISISVDGAPGVVEDLHIPGEDVLVRVSVGEYGAGPHAVTVTHVGPEGSAFYFDFLEIAAPASSLPAIAPDAKVALATDWDTDHSICLAPERTAWMIHSLGFHGRVNHYVGALWFYELTRVGHEYASGTVTFSGTPEFSATTEIKIGRTDEPPEKQTTLTHLNLMGDTAESIAKAFELEINRGYMAMRATAEGSVLTIWARAMGAEGNKITLEASPASGPFTAQASGATLTGGVDGNWRTDLAATPRLNRAVRDWSRSFFTALSGHGLEAVAAFSLELQHGDPSPEAGIAQRYPGGDPVLLSTPALQTNFSPTSVSFWKQVYREMAEAMVAAGVAPYLQFGEVQWWYFPDASGMPFADDYTKEQFQATYGRPISVIPNNHVAPSQYPEEAAFLPGLIGSFTNQIIAYVRETLPACKFEVLYPPDVNEPQFNRVVNLPGADWTPAKLDSFKTESFTYTYSRDLDKSAGSIEFSRTLGFACAQRAHLVGLSDWTAPWQKEVRRAKAEGLANVVLFALDQFALIGYAAPVPEGRRRALFLG